MYTLINNIIKIESFVKTQIQSLTITSIFIIK